MRIWWPGVAIVAVLVFGGAGWLLGHGRPLHAAGLVLVFGALTAVARARVRGGGERLAWLMIAAATMILAVVIGSLD